MNPMMKLEAIEKYISDRTKEEWQVFLHDSDTRIEDHRVLLSVVLYHNDDNSLLIEITGNDPNFTSSAKVYGGFERCPSVKFFVNELNRLVQKYTKTFGTTDLFLPGMFDKFAREIAELSRADERN